jgi:hypothetical protein
MPETEKKVIGAHGWKVRVPENHRGGFETEFFHDIEVHPQLRVKPEDVIECLEEVYGEEWTAPYWWRMRGQSELLVHNLHDKDLRLLCIKIDKELLQAIITYQQEKDTPGWMLIDRCIQDLYEEGKLKAETSERLKLLQTAMRDSDCYRGEPTGELDEQTIVWLSLYEGEVVADQINPPLLADFPGTPTTAEKSIQRQEETIAEKEKQVKEILSKYKAEEQRKIERLAQANIPEVSKEEFGTEEFYARLPGLKGVSWEIYQAALAIQKAREEIGRIKEAQQEPEVPTAPPLDIKEILKGVEEIVRNAEEELRKPEALKQAFPDKWAGRLVEAVSKLKKAIEDAKSAEGAIKLGLSYSEVLDALKKVEAAGAEARNKYAGLESQMSRALQEYGGVQLGGGYGSVQKATNEKFVKDLLPAAKAVGTAISLITQYTEALYRHCKWELEEAVRKTRSKR